MRVATSAAVLVALAIAGSGCRHRDEWAPRERTPGVDGESAAPMPKESTKAWMLLPAEAGIAGSGKAALAEFAAKLAAAPRAASVGVLPFVMYDSDHPGPWVPRLGTDLADAAAAAVREAGFRGSVLDTAGMEMRLHQVNLAKVSLYSPEGVADAGDRIGVDLVVFGTMRREKSRDQALLSTIRIDLQAHSFVTGASAGSASFVLRSNSPENGPAYEAARTESLWKPGTWDVPATPRAFDEELRIVADLLAKRVVQSVDLEAVKGIVYVPPADTGRFVRSVARLRAAQAAFVLEHEKRSKEAGRGEDPMAVEKPITLNGVEFKTLQAAFSYLSTLRESLLTAETARFAGTVTSILVESLKPMVSPRKVIQDIGFTEASDVALLEGDLATGGLVRSLRSREALAKKDIGLVIAPKIERVGTNYALRAEVYDLARPNVVASSSVRIDKRYAADLARMLEQEELAAIDDLPQIERQSWERVFEKVVSGGVVLFGKAGAGQAQGSGFVVSREGHIMTNSHVVRAIEGGSGQVQFSGGSQAPYTVVKDDPFWDVAVVKVDSLPEGTHVFAFADPDRAKVGAEVAVLGAPKGTNGWIFTPGHISSVKEVVPTSGPRPSYMYTCPTRCGSSGSPVVLTDGSVVAMHSAGTIGDVRDLSGAQVTDSKGSPVVGELSGFALGAPGVEARKVLDGTAGTR